MNVRGSCIPGIPLTSYAFWPSGSLPLCICILDSCLFASLPLPLSPCPRAPSIRPPRQRANLLTRPLNLSPQLEVANCDFKFSTHPPPELVPLVPSRVSLASLVPMSPCPPVPSTCVPSRASYAPPHPKMGQTTSTGSDPVFVRRGCVGGEEGLILPSPLRCL